MIGLTPPMHPKLTLAASKKDGPQDITAILKNWLAGGIAAGVSKTAMGPIELVKLRLQNDTAVPSLYNGSMLKCATMTVRDEGVLALWKGTVPNVLRYFPQQAFNFAFKDYFKSLFPKYSPKTDFWRFFGANLASGSLAGAASLTIVYPLDFARTRLANDAKGEYNGMMDCLVKIARAEGIGGLYFGFPISIVGIVAYRGSYFGLFDTAKGVILGENEATASFFIKFAIAQSVSMAASVISYPFDTVRRLQMKQAGVPDDQKEFKGAFEATAAVYKKFGIGGFFKGVFANIIRGVGGALVLVLYDEVKKFIQ